jgi:hypothetical protein
LKRERVKRDKNKWVPQLILISPKLRRKREENHSFLVIPLMPLPYKIVATYICC